MRRGTLTFIAAVCLCGCTAAYALDTNLAFRIGCEVQTAGMQSLPDLTWVQGSTPLIEAQILRNGRQVSLSTNVRARMLISSNLYAATSWAVATNTVLTTNAAASSMWIQWGEVGTNSCAAGTNEPSAWGYTMFFEDSATGTRYWNGAGRLYVEKSTATGDGLTWLNPTSLTSLAWGQIYGDPTNNAALVAYIATSAGADTVARAGVASNSASILAVGAVASNAVPASAYGTFTNTVESVSTPFGTNRPATINNKGGFVRIEREYSGMVGSNAASLFGYDLRHQGGAELWLQSAWASAITNYAPATILFARGGTNFADTNIAWSISVRPPETAIHDGYNQFTIFEGPAVAGVTKKRLGIFPTGSVTIAYGNGNIGSTPPMSTGQPFPGAALTVWGTEGESLIAAIGNYTNPSAGRGTLVLGAGHIIRTELTAGGSGMDFALTMKNTAGTNVALSVNSTGRVIVTKATITNASITSLALGTNAAVSDWPASGGGISASDATNIAQAVVAEATTNDMTGIDWASLGGSGGGTSTNDVRAIRDEDFRAYTTLALDGGTALVSRASGRWLMIEADNGEVTLDVDAASYTNALEGIQHNVMWIRGTNATYSIVTNNIANSAYVDAPVSTTNHFLLEKRPGWARFQIWQDNR